MANPPSSGPLVKGTGCSSSSCITSGRLWLQVLLLLCLLPLSQSGRQWLPQGPQSTLLCRCQAVYEDLYAGQGPGEGPNDRRNRELQQLDDRGYIVIDGITVLPDTRPVCQETRQRKRAAGVYRRQRQRDLRKTKKQGQQPNQLMSTNKKFKKTDPGEDKLVGDVREQLDEEKEDEVEEEDAEEFVDFADEEEYEEEGRDEELEEVAAAAATTTERDFRRRLATSRSLKGSKSGGGSKGGGGGGGKGGSWGWNWHSGKGGGKGGGGGSKGGGKGSDWGWGGGKGKGGGGGGGGNPNWRPTVFPCPRPPNNQAPTPTPGTDAPTAQVIPEPTGTPTTNVVVPTPSPTVATGPPNPLVPTTSEPTVGTDIPTQDLTAAPTVTNFPTTGGTDQPTVTQFPTTGTEAPTLGTDAPTASQVITPAPVTPIPTIPLTATPTDLSESPSSRPSSSPSSLAPIPFNRRDDEPCVVSTGIQCTTFRGRSCQDLFKPATLVCEPPQTELSFLFIPDTCNDDATATSGTNCTDDLAFIDGEFMIQCQGGEGGATLVAAPMLVTPGDTFAVRRGDNGTLPDQITCSVFDNFGRRTQQVSFDATVNPNVYTLKQRVGALTLQGCGAKYCIENVVYRYEVSNEGNSPMTVTEMTLTEAGGLHRENDDLQCKLQTTRLGPQQAETIEETQEIDLCGLCEYEAILRVKGTPYPNNGKECQAQSVYRLNIEAPPGTS